MMPLPLTGSVSVTNGDDAFVWTGAPLTALNCVVGASIVVNGLGYFIKELNDTTNAKFTRVYAEATSGSQPAEIEQLSPDQVATATLNKRAVQLFAQLSVVEANGRGLFYRFSDSVTDSDPGAGYLRFNNSSIGSATTAYVDVLDANGAGVAGVIDSWDDQGTPGARGQLWVRSASDPSAFHALKVTGSVVDGTGYRKLTLVYVGGSGGFAVDDELMVMFSAQGADGTNAILGAWQGPWVTGFAYGVDDLVEQGGSTYICLVAHTAGTFATDLAAAKWELAVEKGNTGDAATIAVGGVTTVAPGAPAAVSNSGTTGAAVFDFDIPQGATGATGITWQRDYSGATAYVVDDGVLYNGSSWRALGATTGNAPPTLPTTSNAYWQLLARQGIDGAGTVSSVVAGVGIAIDNTDPTAPVVSATNQITANENAEWLHRAALLDPAAYIFYTGAFDITVPVGETWLIVNAWYCNFGTSTGLWFHRNLKVSEAMELPSGTRVKNGHSANGAFLLACRPALVLDNTPYLNPKDLYFQRLEALRAIVPSQVTVTVPLGSARGTVVYQTLPADFEDGMLVQVSTNDTAWTVLALPDGSGASNTLDEISDDHQMRLSGKMLVPFRRKLMPVVRAHGASVSGNASDLSIANAHSVLIYQKLSPTWRTMPRSFYREAVLVDTPMLYYGMDEASGSTIASVGSSGVAANVLAPVLFGAPGAPGDNGTGIQLSSGDDGRLEIPGGSGLDFGGGNFTLEGWVKFKTIPSAASADPWIINAWQDDVATPNSFLLSVYSGKLRLFWRDSAATTVTVDSTVTLVAGKYYHFIAGRNGTNIFVRIVGFETRQTAAVTGTMAPLGANKVSLGIGYGGTVFNYRLDGSLDEVAMYTSALSDAQADAHHAASIGW